MKAIKLLCIYGGGGLGKEILFLLTARIGYKKAELLIVDDLLSSEVDEIEGVPVKNFKQLSSEVNPSSEHEFVIAVGSPVSRSDIYWRLKNSGATLKTVVDPHSILSDSVILAPGVVISWQCSVSNNTKIGANTFINIGTIIGHDVQVGENCSLASQVNLGGGVEIGSRTFLGSGVRIRDKVRIGSNVLVGAGSVVLKDVPNDVVVLGNPAKVIAPNRNFLI